MKKKVWLPTIIMFFFGVLFLMPIILLVMNAFKTHNDMIQNFLSFPALSLYRKLYRSYRTSEILESSWKFSICNPGNHAGMYHHFLYGCIWNCAHPWKAWKCFVSDFHPWTDHSVPFHYDRAFCTADQRKPFE